MTVQGSNTFADAPVLAVGEASLATPNGSFGTETGEPAHNAATRTAWWRLEPTVTTYANLYLGGSGLKYLDVFTGTTLADLTLQATNDDSSTALIGFPLIAGETYWVRAGLYPSDPATDYVLSSVVVAATAVDLTPIHDTPTMRSVSASPSGELFAGIIETPWAYGLMDWGVWVGTRLGGEMIEVGRIDVAGLVTVTIEPGSAPPHAVNWIRFISDEVVMFEVRYGNGAQQATRIFFATPSGSGLNSEYYPLIPGDPYARYSRDFHMTGDTITLLGLKIVNSVTTVHFVSFTLTGLTASNVTVGAALGVTAANLDLAATKFLDNGDALLNIVNSGTRQVCTQAGQLYTAWNWKGPLASVSSSVAQMYQGGADNPVVNGRYWTLAYASASYGQVPQGMAMFSVDPYTGTFAGPYPGMPSALSGSPATQVETAPGLWLVIWLLGNNDQWGVLVDLNGATPVVVWQRLIVSTAYRMFIKPEHDGFGQGLAVRGEEPTGVIRTDRAHSDWVNGKYQLNWYPTYVEPPNVGGLVASRRAFVG